MLANHLKEEEWLLPELTVLGEKRPTSHASGVSTWGSARS